MASWIQWCHHWLHTLGIALLGAPSLPTTYQVPVDYSWVYKTPSFPGSVPGQGATRGGLLYTHMGMLTMLPNGSLAAAWQGSTDSWEGSPNQSLYWSVSSDNAQTWSPHQLLVPPRPPGLPVWGPVLHNQDGTMHLFYSASVEQCGGWGETGQGFSPGGDIFHMTSGDSGATWSSPAVIYPFSDRLGIPKVTANRLAVLDDGSWLLPVWHEGSRPDCGQGLRSNGAPGMLLSVDQGKSFEPILLNRPNATWLIEPTVVALKPDRPDMHIPVGLEKDLQPKVEDPQALALFRTKAGVLYQSIGYGREAREWTQPEPINVRNPDSKVSMDMTPVGTMLLAFNDASQLESGQVLWAQ
ncbi:hypothetical protein WJX84_005204 [Apatococcus fuscideae]|uniref:Sialidase domain-containing protein n=1 Tax=Apatococcus fuscideae TaxID=2026836 RepID=A0AAW1T262_9CHLO